MHIIALQELIECCRQRESDGDHPRQERPSVGMLEDAVLDLAADNDRLRKQINKWIEDAAENRKSVKDTARACAEIAGSYASCEGIVQQIEIDIIAQQIEIDIRAKYQIEEN